MFPIAAFKTDLLSAASWRKVQLNGAADRLLSANHTFVFKLWAEAAAIRQGNQHFTTALAKIGENSFSLLREAITLFLFYSTHVSYLQHHLEISSEVPADNSDKRCSCLHLTEDFIYTPGKPPWQHCPRHSNSVGACVLVPGASISEKKGSNKKGSIRWCVEALENKYGVWLLVSSSSFGNHWNDTKLLQELVQTGCKQGALTAIKKFSKEGGTGQYWLCPHKTSWASCISPSTLY